MVFLLVLGSIFYVEKWVLSCLFEACEMSLIWITDISFGFLSGVLFFLLLECIFYVEKMGSFLFI